MAKKTKTVAKKRDTIAECNEKRAEATKLFAKAIKLSIEADYLLGHCLPDENIENMIGIVATIPIWEQLIATAFEHAMDDDDEFVARAVELSELISVPLLGG